MSEVSNTINLNIPNANNRTVTQAFVNKKLPVGTGYAKNIAFESMAAVCHHDYFTHSLASQKSKKNPVAIAFDDCLAHVAPKPYLNKYVNKKALETAAKSNPRISELLASSGLDVNIDVNNVTGKIQNHFLETYNLAKNLGHNLPADEHSALLQAAILHDIGKAFIPREILDKPSSLSQEERKIVDLHAEIGAEVLKAMNMNPKTVEAVRLHHTKCSNPIKQNSQMSQILSVADVYTALRDERPYKKPFTVDEVREIMQNDSRLNQDVVSDLFFSIDLSDMKNFKVKKTA